MTDLVSGPSLERHPKRSRARILLTSVFGPYAQDDDFGSRRINPMELYHNQVTREQGAFSLRMFHRSWGLMMIQRNISAPCTVLDFPTREIFARELATGAYDIVSGFGTRAMGIGDPHSEGSVAAAIVPSVGCPMGCNFCATSAFFGGKGNFHNFYETGDELFGVMSEAESALKARSFFIMDENFLLYRKRAIQLLDRMKSANKAWALYVFASANAIRQYSIDELVALGISWIWMGLESPQASYEKLHGSDTLTLARELHSHGIKLLGSTIIGLEHHTPENIEKEIEHAVAHRTDFHQFMLYTPAPGTPLYSQMRSEGRMLEGLDVADMHGQDRFNFRHAAISRDDSKRWLDWAFRRDFRCNGPSLFRICRTTLQGWRRYKNHSDPRIRRRFEWESRSLRTSYSALLWAMEHRLRSANPLGSARIRALRIEIGREFGLVSRLAAYLLGPVLLWTTIREERRLARGVTYEPGTILERRNWPAAERPLAFERTLLAGAPAPEAVHQ